MLAAARQDTLDLVAPVSREDMDRVHSPLMSPLVWDLGHIAAFEDLWLCHRAGGLPLLRDDLADVYDAFETPRAGRGDLPYLRLPEALAYMEEVRGRSLEVLDRVDLSAAGDRLNAHGFVWDMLVQHEQQHNETMLQTLALAEHGAYVPARRGPPEGPQFSTDDMARVEAGVYPIGDPGAGFAYDNERPAHEVALDAYLIDRTPVTAGSFLEFIEDGGYERRELWGDEGWEWRSTHGVERPLYWSEDGRVRSFDRLEPVDARLPVTHVSWHEAEAFARWAGKRLPTEQEWEVAACFDPATGQRQRFPWGDDDPRPERANLDVSLFGPAPVGSYPEGVSPLGVLGAIGDVWEWTSSEFTGYPDFHPFPYREYSEVFFGRGYRVLRGGSWAVRGGVIRASFRNWDHPHRRQIFSGFRCASDA